MLRDLFLSAVLALGLTVVPAYSEDRDVDVDVDVDADEPTGMPMIFFSAGGNNSLSDLNNDADFNINSNFQTGYNLTGGLGIQLSNWAALRGVYTYSRSRADGDEFTVGTGTGTGTGTAVFSPISGSQFHRHYYGADLQFRGNMDSGFSPYLFVGGGAVTVDPDDNAVLLSPTGARFDNDTFTKPAGRFGLGFEYQIPNSGFGLFAEGSGWVYNWDRYGFDRTQFDTNYGGGITYRFGY
jgi:hypothetical protein